MFMLHFLANIPIWLNTESVTMLAFYGAQVVFSLLYIYLTRLFLQEQFLTARQQYVYAFGDGIYYPHKAEP